MRVPRAYTFPAAPTIAQAGVPGYATVQWHGILAPAGTPAPIIDKLHAEFKAALTADATRKRLLDAGTEMEYLGPAEFGAFYQREMDQWASVIRKANIRLSE